MSSGWSDFVSISGTSLSLLGVIVSLLTLATANQIRNRIKDGKIIKNFKQELINRTEKISSDAIFLPSDYDEQTKRICKECMMHVRKRNRKNITNRVEHILEKSRDEQVLLLKEIIIELDDEGV